MPSIRRRTRSRIIFEILLGVSFALTSLGCAHTVSRPLTAILSEPSNRLTTHEGDKISGFETSSQEVPLAFGRARALGDSIHFNYFKLVTVTNPSNIRSTIRVPADTVVAQSDIAYLWEERPDTGRTVEVILLPLVAVAVLFGMALSKMEF